MVRILTEPKNSLVKQYSKLFEYDDVKIEFDEGALRSIAQKAIERNTGARGLRSIVEHSLMETMFEVPSIDNIEKVIVTKGSIENEDEKPLIIYKDVRDIVNDTPIGG